MNAKCITTVQAMTSTRELNAKQVNVRYASPSPSMTSINKEQASAVHVHLIFEPSRFDKLQPGDPSTLKALLSKVAFFENLPGQTIIKYS